MQHKIISYVNLAENYYIQNNEENIPFHTKLIIAMFLEKICQSNYLLVAIFFIASALISSLVE